MTVSTSVLGDAARTRRFDVVLFGATGFAGRLAAHYLADHAPPGVRVALAGRSISKLERVRAGLPASAGAWELVPADTSDPRSLLEMAQSTRVLASTVGPFIAYGLPVVAACVEAGTDYADITGEVLFMRESINRFSRSALHSGVRVVHACGFDSAPSDLGVLALSRFAEELGVGQLLETTAVFKLSGGLSGGTVETMRRQLRAEKSDATARQILADPYSLSPARWLESDLGPQPDVAPIARDRRTGDVLAPFVMGPGNARVVRRSNALDGHRYGKAFRYHEYMTVGGGVRGAIGARAIATGTAVLARGLSGALTAKAFDRALPRPGSGPSEHARDRGYYQMTITAQTTEGQCVRCQVASKGDPGYKANASLIAEAALCLAVDAERASSDGGVLTPATAMGASLIERLQRAGHSFELSIVD